VLNNPAWPLANNEAKRALAPLGAAA